MGILSKKKIESFPEISQEVRDQVESELLQHFSRYEFSRKDSEIALSKMLIDSLLIALFSRGGVEAMKPLLADNDANLVAWKLGAGCKAWAEHLDEEDKLEPLIDEYFWRARQV